MMGNRCFWREKGVFRREVGVFWHELGLITEVDEFDLGRVLVVA